MGNRRDFLLAATSSVLPGMFTVPALAANTSVSREVYIIAGQSNAEGRGLLTDMPDLLPHDRVFMYLGGSWYPAAEPVHPGAGVGPGLSFGTTLAKLRPNTLIGLVPCAYGGSSMADWARNLDPKSLYGEMVAKASGAERWGAIKGVIFDEGESEAMTSYAIANAWDTNFLQWVRNVRTDLGIPNLPVVFAIKRNNPNRPELPYWDAMRAAQLRVSGANIASIQQADLPFRTDAPEQVVHLSTAGQMISGQRFAAAMNRLL